ncbi:hypothetical protein AGR1B_Cc120512 [Agrobacterium fabacearum S56]|nr:hypothetical protein AGR1B_Cc120512 [Agrobacterium fabacearum S56]
MLEYFITKELLKSAYQRKFGSNGYRARESDAKSIPPPVLRGPIDLQRGEFYTIGGKLSCLRHSTSSTRAHARSITETRELAGGITKRNDVRGLGLFNSAHQRDSDFKMAPLSHSASVRARTRDNRLMKQPDNSR